MMMIILCFLYLISEGGKWSRFGIKNDYMRRDRSTWKEDEEDEREENLLFFRPTQQQQQQLNSFFLMQTWLMPNVCCWSLAYLFFLPHKHSPVHVDWVPSLSCRMGFQQHQGGVWIRGRWLSSRTVWHSVGIHLGNDWSCGLYCLVDPGLCVGNSICQTPPRSISSQRIPVQIQGKCWSMVVEIKGKEYWEITWRWRRQPCIRHRHTRMKSEYVTSTTDWEIGKQNMSRGKREGENEKRETEVLLQWQKLVYAYLFSFSWDKCNSSCNVNSVGCCHHHCVLLQKD